MSTRGLQSTDQERRAVQSRCMTMPDLGSMLSIENLREFQEAVAGLPKGIRNRLAKRAIKPGADHILKAIKQNIRWEDKTGETRKDLKVRSAGPAGYSVGFSSGKGGRAYIAYFLEHGTATNPDGDPFFWEAVFESWPEAAQMIADNVAAIIHELED